MATQKHTSPKNGLTPTFLDNLKPADKRIELRDTRTPGLRLRLEPTGRKTFVWYYKEATKTKVLTLGQYGEGEGKISLKQAREELDKAKERHREGERPGLTIDAPKTVAELAELFYERRIVPHRTRPDVVRAILDNDIIPTIGAKKPQTLTAPTVAAVVESVVDRGATVHAGKVLATLKQMFRFAEGRGYIDRSPAYALDRKDLGVQDNIRDRHLDAEEVKAVWQAIEKAPRMSEQTRIGLKILLLTGVRTGELLKARWEHIKSGEWFIPEENSKTTAWTVPLVPEVQALFERLRDIVGNSVWVLPGKVAPSKVIPGKKEDTPLTDKTVGRAMRRLFELKTKKEGKEVPLLDIAPCSPHDFRRTLRTQMDNLGVEPHIAEKCLNHSLGRIEKTYNRNTLLNQRREALQKWADWVDLVVTDREKVTTLERKETSNG
ncbi:tyrosine-type recombinase/integrase [Gammaproteobacteria bacterium]|nr:tyrosine-type recombinase/integrase [Gammaproteobacteria bacterium]